MIDPDASLASRRIAILGLGLMGGSLALALRGCVAELLAVDPDPSVRALALERRIVDRITAEPDETTLQADVIILSAPVRVILEHIQLLGELARDAQRSIQPQNHGSTIVLDIGSTKLEIVQAMRSLPEVFDPLGGHPICGKETPGLAHADGELFRGAAFIFTSLERTSSRARSFANSLAAALQAHPMWIDAPAHDHGAAYTSHLPYLVANALASVTPTQAAALIGSGFRSTSRLAPTSLPVMLDILRTNRQPVLEALHSFQSQVGMFEQFLTLGDFSGLSDLLEAGAHSYHSLLQPS